MLEKNPGLRATFTDLKKMLFFKNTIWTNVTTQRLVPPYNFPKKTLPQNPINVYINHYSGNVTFEDFDFQYPPSRESQARIFEDVINTSLKRMDEMQKRFDKQMSEMEKTCEKTMNVVKLACNQKLTEIEKICNKKICDIEKIYNDKIDQLKGEFEKKQEIYDQSLVIRKRPGPHLEDYDSKSNKIPCKYCNKGLSDKKSLKKHINSIHNKENYLY